MKKNPITVTYSLILGKLEKILAGVKKPGNYFVQGAKEAPIPRIEVKGVGRLSFPIPKEQIKKMIEQAERAPYGRGQETLVDVSVRKVWQLSPDDIVMSGHSWSECFDCILSKVKEGLGCQEVEVLAELYKFLIYDEGCFFLTHRDTEKTPGMFGTLVVSLPSEHTGGELIVRHAGREATIYLNSVDLSEITFAAFYADCEHEVRPILQGNRVSLIYNLIQKTNSKKLPTAPIYIQEAVQAASILHEHLLNVETPKLAWLLEHQYSSAELSFQKLKNADAALAKVLSEAAHQSGCAIHLAMVHIEEEGIAEPIYNPPYYRYYDEDNEDDEADDNDSTEEAAENDEEDRDFEIIDVTDKNQYMDHWVDLENGMPNFGKIPLNEGEILPEGALDNEPADEERLMESTGNEGASFERAYHRAALVVWHSSRYLEVLLQSGCESAINYLKKQVQAGVSQKEMAFSVNQVLDHWENVPPLHSIRTCISPTTRPDMLKILAYLNGLYVERFIDKIIIQAFDGSENEALAESLHFLDKSKAQELLSKLINRHIRKNPNECIKLLLNLFKENRFLALHGSSELIELLDHRPNHEDQQNTYCWRLSRSEPISPAMMGSLWMLLKAHSYESMHEALTTKIISLKQLFDPEKKVIPLLRELIHQDAQVIKDLTFIRLCNYAAEFLLLRSGYFPEPPKDWSQKISISCDCADCRELQSFATDKTAQVHRFRIRKDRRMHMHETIKKYKLDMSHETERKGSPQTLVCVKNRRSYEALCKRYSSDLMLMQEMAAWLISSPDLSSLLKQVVERGSLIRQPL